MSNAKIRNSRNATISRGQRIQQRATARKPRAAQGISATIFIAKKSAVATNIPIATADRNARTKNASVPAKVSAVRQPPPLAMQARCLQTGISADALIPRAEKDMSVSKAIAVSARRKNAKPMMIVLPKRNVPKDIASFVIQNKKTSKRKSG